MMSNLSLWGHLPNPVGDAEFNFFTWVDMFIFDENIFVYL